jgi:hypothetical protein
LWKGVESEGFVEVCSEEGRIRRVECASGAFGGERGDLSGQDLLGLLQIEAEGRRRSEGVERVEGLDEGKARCFMTEDLAEAVESVMRDVIGGSRVRRGREVCGPGWLIDLSLRLCAGEKVVFVRPGELWRPTVQMLLGRDVQAIVQAPVEEARSLGLCVLEPMDG